MAVKISMTTFVDFVLARGTTRITCVREAKALYGEDYSPARDFYRQLREGIIAVHHENKAVSTLDTIAQQASTRRQAHYAACVAGYKRWRGKKTIAAFPVTNAAWTVGKLEVKLNPELGLVVNGQRHLVKLYFKAVQPTKRQLEVALHLLFQHPGCSGAQATPAILDVQAGRLHVPGAPVASIEALLAGEAAALETMWSKL